VSTHARFDPPSIDQWSSGSMKLGQETIPSFLSIDVEPDALQISRDDREHWPGYGETYGFVASLRGQLARLSGAKPIFGWYYRMDPQIEQVCGRADVAMTAFPDRTAALREEGDYFGVHAHPIRWCTERQLWVHDFGDRQWLRDSTKFALDAFSACDGAPARLFRSGAGFISNEIVDIADGNGVVAEMSLEPVASWGLRSKVVPSAVDTSPIVGEYLNCVAAPRTPYYPSREDFRKHGNGDARRILLIPLTTGPAVLPPRDLMSRLKLTLRRRPEPEPARMLYPAEGDSSERYFWDLVSHRLATMERPYLSLAIRTDRLDSFRAARVCRVFMELLRHPLAKRLRFVDPLEAKDRITPLLADAGTPLCCVNRKGCDGSHKKNGS